MLFQQNPEAYVGKTVVRIVDDRGTELHELLTNKGVNIIFSDGSKIHLEDTTKLENKVA